MSNPEDHVIAPASNEKVPAQSAAGGASEASSKPQNGSSGKQVMVDIVIPKNSAQVPTRQRARKSTTKEVAVAASSSEDEWTGPQAEESESLDSSEESAEEEIIARASVKKARGRKAWVDVDDLDSDDEVDIPHIKLCTKCDRPAQDKKKAAHEDDDLEVPLGRLLQCSTCPVTWHEPCMGTMSRPSLGGNLQCATCFKDGPECELCHLDVEKDGPILFRCFRCNFPAHMDCILQQYLDDVDEGGRTHIPSGPGSRTSFQTEWKCVDCMIWNDHVESIITYRTVVDEESMEDATRREYYVKFKTWSFRHCTWVTERWLSNLKAERQRYRVFMRRVAEENKEAITAGETPPWPKSVEDALPPGVLEVERVLDAQYYDCYGKEDFDNVKKVLIKWRGLPHDSLYWETPFDPEDPQYAHLVQQYELFLTRNEIGRRTRVPAKKRSFAEYDSQPSHVVGGELKDYQLDGLNWLMYKWSKGMPSILADDMGLGKTVQIVALLASLHYDKKLGPFLIAAPSSTLGHWMAEFAKWAPNLVVVHYRGTGPSRQVIRNLEIFGPKDSDRDKGKNVRMHILLANYETLTTDSKFFKSIKFDALICDEGHRLKNDAAKIFNAFRDHLNVGHKIILTGTPLQNNIRELFNLLCFLDPTKFGNPAQWEEKYGEDALTDAMVKEIHELLTPYILRRTKDKTDLGLPPKVEIVVPLSLSPLQTELYKGVLAKNAALLKSIGVSTSGKADVRVSSLKNILMDLRSVCNHPYILPGIEPSEASGEEAHRNLIDASAKVTLLHKMLPKLKAAGHRVLLFSQFKQNLDIIQDYLEVEGYGWCRMDGDTPIPLRQGLIDDFNSPDSNALVFLLTTRTGAEGINLTAADTIILYDADWNPQRDIQAMSRAHRIGQKNPVVVYRFFHRRCVEEKILEAGKKKLVLNHLLIAQMASTEDAPEDLSSIIRYGAKALFEEDAATASASQIKYDDAEVDKLLDRSAIFAEPAVKEGEKDEPAGFKLGAFAKLWQSEKPEFDESAVLVDLGADATAADAEDQSTFWDNVLKETAAQRAARDAIEHDDWGRARRKRKSVNYSESAKKQKLAEPELWLDDDEDLSELAAVPEIEDTEFQPEDSPHDQDDDEDAEMEVEEELLSEIIVPKNNSTRNGSFNPKPIADSPATSASATREINTLGRAGQGQPGAKPPPSAPRPTVQPQPLPSHSQKAPPRPVQRDQAVVPPIKINETLIKAAQTLVRSYTSPNRPPACWLCFSERLHPIDECPMRRNQAYLLDAFIQMECCVQTLRLPQDISLEFVFKMRILESFLRALNVSPPGRIFVPSPAPQPSAPSGLRTNAPKPATPTASPQPLQPATLQARLAMRGTPSKAGGTPTTHAPATMSAAVPAASPFANQSGDPETGPHQILVSGPSSSVSALTPSATPAQLSAPVSMASTIAVISPVSNPLLAPLSPVALNGSSTANKPSTSHAWAPASSNISAPSLSTPSTASGGLQVNTTFSMNGTSVSGKGMGGLTVTPTPTTPHMPPPVPRSGAPSPPVVRPHHQPASVPQRSGPSTLTALATSLRNAANPSSAINQATQPPANFLPTGPLASPAGLANPPALMKATTMGGGLQIAPILRSQAPPLGATFASEQPSPTPTATYPGPLPSAIPSTSAGQPLSNWNDPRGNSSQSPSLHNLSQLATASVTKCLICKAYDHPTESASCPLIYINPSEYHRRLVNLLQTGQILHLTLKQVQDMRSWVHAAQSRAGNLLTAGAPHQAAGISSSAAPQALTAISQPRSGYVRASALPPQTQTLAHQPQWQCQQQQDGLQQRQQQHLLKEQLHQQQQQLRQLHQQQRQVQQERQQQHHQIPPAQAHIPQPQSQQQRQSWQQPPHQQLAPQYISPQEQQAAIVTYHNYLARGGGSSNQSRPPPQQNWNAHSPSMSGAGGTTAPLQYQPASSSQQSWSTTSAYSTPLSTARIVEVANEEQTSGKK
ncbi:SNF2 family N-terminal domain-containing protein [Geranomyces variabilis]|nr:SNF2 family N-terminal domain-containing protein [Geranomyces variabilis]KAJ3142767.1 hypothetical protein HDU90_002638 [Geranomyces variabilis]